MKKLIIASTSTLHGGNFLEYLLPQLAKHFRSISNLLFIPYARPGGMSHKAYTEIVREALKSLAINVKGIHEFDDPAGFMNLMILQKLLRTPRHFMWVVGILLF